MSDVSAEAASDVSDVRAPEARASIAAGGDEPAPARRRAGARRRWHRRWPARSVAALLWAVLAIVGFLLIVRSSPGDPRVPYLWAITFLPLVLVATAIVLPLSLLLRRRALPLACVALLGIGAWVYAPDWGPGPQAVPEGWSQLRVVSANVRFDTPSMAPVIAALDRHDPDVVVLQELREDHVEDLERAGVLASYPFVVWDDDEMGTLVASRLPLSSPRVIVLGDRGQAVATLTTPVGELDLVGVHIPAPTLDTDVWADQLAGLERLTAGLERPLLVGDFNATTDHDGFRRLLASGLVDGHQEAGEGFGATWPVGDPNVPWPVLRIDHVLAGEGLAVTSLVTEDLAHSDHRLLVADVAVAPAGEAATSPGG